IAVKPIGSFLAKFNDLLARCRDPDGPRRIAVIGGGAGGAELLLSVRSRLLKESAATKFSFTLVTHDAILPPHNARLRRAFRRVAAQRGVVWPERRQARGVTASAAVLVGV